MSTLLAPFESFARWCQKLHALWAGRAGDVRQQHGARNAAGANPGPLAGKWPDQTDMMTRLTDSGAAVRVNGSRTAREADDRTHETRRHHESFAHDEPRLHNVYRFPHVRS